MPTTIVTNDPAPQTSTLLTPAPPVEPAPDAPAVSAPPVPDETSPAVSAAAVAAPTPDDLPPEPPETPEDGEGDEEPQTYGRRAQRRITRLLQDRTRLAVELDQERARNRALQQFLEPGRATEGERPPVQAPVPTAASASSPRPRLDDYPTHEEWAEALAGWKAEQIVHATLAARDQAEQARQHEEAAVAQRQAWQRQVSHARQTYADYDDVLDQSAVRASPLVQREVLASEQGAALLYYLARHPDEAQALNTLDERALLRRMGQLEAQMQAGHAVPRPQPSATPAPTAPLARPLQPLSSSSEAPPVGGFRDGMSLRDYNRLRDAQQGRAG